jgi:hypothetical protein
VVGRQEGGSITAGAAAEDDKLGVDGVSHASSRAERTRARFVRARCIPGSVPIMRIFVVFGSPSQERLRCRVVFQRQRRSHPGKEALHAFYRAA